jgi:hypothetical protein
VSQMGSEAGQAQYLGEGEPASNLHHVKS